MTRPVLPGGRVVQRPAIQVPATRLPADAERRAEFERIAHEKLTAMLGEMSEALGVPLPTLPTDHGDDDVWGPMVNAAIQAAYDTAAAALVAADDLSDLASPSAARANLGLGTAAVAASTSFDAAGAAAAVLASSLQKSSNLSDVASAGTARANLGLGTAATISATAGGDLSGTLPSPSVVATHLASPLPINQGGTGAASASAAATALGVTYPWQFKVEDYGATGNGFVASDVATNSTNTFTSATIAANGAVGQYVMINGGRGTADSAAIGQITAINTGTHAVTISASLAINATATGLNAICGTDDQAAIVSAFAAAKTYAEAHDYFAEVLFKDRIYVLASGPTQTNGSPAVQNSQLPIPYPTNNNGRKLIFAVTGVGRVDHLQYWNSTVPNVAGTVLVSMTTAPSSIDSTFGPQSVLGGPTGQQGFVQGGALGTAFANVKPVVQNIQILCPVYTNMTAFDFTYVTGVYVDGCSAHIFAQPLSGGGPLLNAIWNDDIVFLSRQGVGMRFPAGGNNADNSMPSFAVEGYAIGIMPDEHTWIGNLKAIYVGIVIKLGTNSQGHGLQIDRVTAEAYQGGILATSGGIFPIFVGGWATEDSATAYDISDSSNQLTGVVHWSDVVDSRGPVVSGTANLRIVNDKLGPGKWTSAPAVPASTVAAQNTAWRDAAVVVSGGTVTVITVDGVAQGITSGMVIVPSGKNIAITYSVAPTWKWTLM